MKLVIDCRMLGSGGIGTYLQSILPYLIKNFDCTLLLKTKDIHSYENIKGIKLLECNIPNFSIKELLQFPPSLLEQINKCHVYYSPYCNIPGGIKIPVYTTIHDVVFLDVKGLSGKAGTIARKCFYQHAINKSKAVFTVSQFSKNRIIANLNTKNKPVIVTYNSVPEWFLESTKDQKEIQKNYNLLFVGNIKRHKGLHTLLEAFTILQNKGFKNKLIIVGNSENFRTTDDSVLSKLQTIPDIEFTGRITDEQLKQLYKKSRLLIQPSLYEGFGMPPMEALYSGTNAVISDIEVFKEIYKDLPVTFFKCEDSSDLAEKIEKALTLPDPENLPELYSFEKTSDIIINTIKDN